MNKPMRIGEFYIYRNRPAFLRDVYIYEGTNEILYDYEVAVDKRKWQDSGMDDIEQAKKYEVFPFYEGFYIEVN